MIDISNEAKKVADSVASKITTRELLDLRENVQLLLNQTKEELKKQNVGLHRELTFAKVSLQQLEERNQRLKENNISQSVLNCCHDLIIEQGKLICQFQTNIKELKYKNDSNECALAQSVAESTVIELVRALELIANWRLPRAKCKDWTEVNAGRAKEPTEFECSYGVAYGSNGERDYIINVAKEALKKYVN